MVRWGETDKTKLSCWSRWRESKRKMYVKQKTSTHTCWSLLSVKPELNSKIDLEKQRGPSLGVLYCQTDSYLIQICSSMYCCRRWYCPPATRRYQSLSHFMNYNSLRRVRFFPQHEPISIRIRISCAQTVKYRKWQPLGIELMIFTFFCPFGCFVPEIFKTDWRRRLRIICH